jgi:ATP adenylyltransferase
MRYIEQARDQPEGCFLCELPQLGDDEKALILGRDGTAFVILNMYPYNPGHVLVAPFRHVAEPGELTDQEIVDTGHLQQRSLAAIGEELRPDGYNIGLNLGRVAGAGVPGHLHWHVVPRWNGDTNFMSVTAEARVLPESLKETYGKLRRAFG